MRKFHDLLVKFFDNIMFVSSGLVCVLIGYPKGYVASLLAASGILGILIPP
jgi:TRAP-type C4-dicarboxylate transport system permease large subunit